MFNELICFDIPRNIFMNKIIRNHFSPNFKEMINELKESHNVTCEQIAYLLEVGGASSINDWEKGRKPNYENGALFIDLWKSLTNKFDEDIPRVNHYILEI